MKKEGFTLVELLATIAILAFVSILIIPNVIEYFKKGTTDAMVFQENEIYDAAKLYLQDYYYKPINSHNKEIGNNTFLNLSGNDSQKYLCLNTVIGAGYTKEVKYRGTSCNGIIIFDKSNTGIYDSGKTYLFCEDEYITENANTSYKSKCE